MFRKVNRLLKNRSGNNNNNGSFEQKLDQLEGMGFDRNHASNALEATNGDVEQAMNHLLTNQSVMDADNAGSTANNNGSSRSRDSYAEEMEMETEEQQLQRALEESRMMQNTTSTNSSTSRATGGGGGSARIRSAAAIRAGQAAASRAQNASVGYGANKVVPKKNKTTKSSSAFASSSSSSAALSSSGAASSSLKKLHPNVKMPQKMASKSKEEQILRCTQRLAPHPPAVDTLLNAFMKIRDEPQNDKYRKIDTNSMGYKRVLEDKPGALDLLKAMNFVERGGGGVHSRDLVLIRERVDPALLFLGISALEQIRLSSPEYMQQKAWNKFQVDVEKITSGANGVREEEELVRRAGYLAKVPSEPEGGAGALLQVGWGKGENQKKDENHGGREANNVGLKRRFDGDDVLQDLIHWIGAHGSVIPDKILSREWSLVDLNRYPIAPIDVEGNLDRTLQYIGCWPSGKLEIRPSEKEWMEEKAVKEGMGSSRGLGSAPSSAMNG